MEGPSLLLAKEQLRPFKGKTVLAVSGNTKIGKERFAGQTVRDIFSWGKHLVLTASRFAFTSCYSAHSPQTSKASG